MCGSKQSQGFEITITITITITKVEGNGRVWNFLELISEAYKYELCCM